MKIIPNEIKKAELYAYLVGSIAPRPICFASTVDMQGRPNLSPFSYFNMFGSHPPTLVFSPSLGGHTAKQKDTLLNVLETMEVVINVVTHAMVHQVSLASCEYPRGVNEFEKAGFTPLPSEKVKPFRVKESPVQMECVVKQVIKMGEEGGAGNLVICEPLVIHLDEKILDAKGRIDPQKIDLVGRMGGDYYCRASGQAVFEIAKPNLQVGIGIDMLPLSIRQSRVLSGNHLGQLANVHEIPAIDPSFDDDHLRQIIQYYSLNPEEMEKELHLYAKKLLDQGRVQDAWQVLLAGS